MDAAARLTRLEERYAHLQVHVAQQDKAMLALSDELAKLRRELMMLRSRVTTDAEPGSSAEERPPHY